MSDSMPHPYLALQQSTHGAIRRNIERLATALDPAHLPPPGHIVAGFWAMLEAGIHHHHDAEEQIFLPMMVKNRPDIAGLIDRTGAEHAAVLEAMVHVDRSIKAWMAGDDVAVVREAFAKFVEVGTTHLEQEEADVWPLIPECISLADIAELQAQAKAGVSTTPEEIIPLGFESAPPQVLAMFEATAPAALRDRVLNGTLPAWKATVEALLASSSA